MSDEKIVVENINTPGRTARVNRAKYTEMRGALLQVLPSDPPGLSAAEAKAALLPLLDQDLFPGGAKSGWWHKTVQLDLEAKGLMQRVEGRPLRFYRCGK